MLTTLPVRKLAADVRPPSGVPFVVCAFEDEFLLPMQVVTVRTGLVFPGDICSEFAFQAIHLPETPGIFPLGVSFLGGEMVVMVTVAGMESLELNQRDPFARIIVRALADKDKIRFAVQEPEGGRLIFGEGKKVENSSSQ